MTKKARPSGFTLLEVLIALAILSAVALAALRVTGESLSQAADNDWKDRALLLGRNQLIKLTQQKITANSQGNFAPDYPQISWKSIVTEARDSGGYKLEIIVTEGRREIVLEKLVLR